ncbi:helix-turn-helix transcriptional regulator [Actinocrispum sp. NPDC049592]|uniref:helix-turn-helix domain-containing protein n=1 Tax=Actinocrispum sp. NPDC049592 TaxID=3154835 RepID=UPI00341CBD6F
MAGGVPTVPRRLLGDAIRRLRQQSGKTLDEAAAAIDKNRVQLIRVIEGNGRITAEDLATLLDYLGAGAKEKRELLELGVEARKRSSRRRYADALPREFERFAQIETLATEIWHYSKGVIPGLLQTEDYVQAQMSIGDGVWWEPSWKERRNRIDYRLNRQREMLGADPPKALRFIITDDALRTEMGSPEVMRAQLAHLLHVIDRYPNIDIRVISSTVPGNPAPESGMVLFFFAEPLRPIGNMPVSYGPSNFFEETPDTHKMAVAFNLLQELAMSSAESRFMIEELLSDG